MRPSDYRSDRRRVTYRTARPSLYAIQGTVPMYNSSGNITTQPAVYSGTPTGDPGSIPYFAIQTDVTPRVLWCWDGIEWIQISMIGATPPVEY